PYSIIGIGDLEQSYFNRTSGMANTGIAYSNNNFVTINNPASLSYLTNQLFLVETSARGKYVKYSGTGVTAGLSAKDFSIEKLTLGMRIKKWWGAAAGLMPYSTSNYTFSGTQSLQGSNLTLPVDYDGSGGVNRFFFANGFKITKNLSIGANASYLGGSLVQRDSLFSTDVTSSIFTTKNIYVSNLYLDYGLQYHMKLSKKWNATLGFTYAPETALHAQNTALIKDGKGDTLSNVTLTSTIFTLPNTTGFGISIIKDNRLTFVADYRYQAWSSLNISGINYRLVNSNRYSAGVEYSKQKEYQGSKFEVSYLQAGAFYNQSYLQISNEQIADRGFTLGAGFNSKRSTLSYHFAFEYGIRGSGITPVKENYTNFTIGLSYKDFWNTKGRKYN
ncbi:MAG: hypothetical protein ABI358_04155, partial [Ginsengibacter sp.]